MLLLLFDNSNFMIVGYYCYFDNININIVGYYYYCNHDQDQDSTYYSNYQIVDAIR